MCHNLDGQKFQQRLMDNKPTKKERYINPVSTAVTFFSFGFWFLKKYESTKKC